MDKINFNLSLNPKCFQIPDSVKDHFAELKSKHNSQISKQWQVNNKEKLSKYYANKRKTNSQYKIYDNTLGNLRNCIYSFKKYGKASNTNFINLGFTKLEFIQHLEKHFDKNMNWENYGKYWCIDHIKPASSFVFESTEDQAFLDCFDLSNLQPLCKKQNRTKSDKV